MSNDKTPKPLFDKNPQQPSAAAPPIAKPAKGPRPLFGAKAMANMDRSHQPPNAVFDARVQGIIDTHLKAIMSELEAADVKPVGVVSGVLHDGETSVNWCISDDVHDDDGKLLTTNEVAHEIAVDIERSTAGE